MNRPKNAVLFALLAAAALAAGAGASAALFSWSEDLPAARVDRAGASR